MSLLQLLNPCTSPLQHQNSLQNLQRWRHSLKNLQKRLPLKPLTVLLQPRRPFMNSLLVQPWARRPFVNSLTVLSWSGRLSPNSLPALLWLRSPVMNLLSHQTSGSTAAFQIPTCASGTRALQSLSVTPALRLSVSALG